MNKPQLEEVVFDAFYRVIRIPRPPDIREFLKRTLQRIWNEDVVHLGGEGFPYSEFVVELQIGAAGYDEEFGGLMPEDITRNKDNLFSELITDIGRLLGSK